ncbi:MAG: N-acetylglucosamine-6-phosphate deacetylase [Pseudomonadota bacterium]
MATSALVGARVFDGERFLPEHAVVLQAGLVDTVCRVDQLASGIERLDLGGGVLAPGFIDIQVNGGGGVLLNNAPTTGGLQTLVDAHRAGGTTACMPTIITDAERIQKQALEAFEQADAAGVAGLLGIHFEGPYLSTRRRGVHSDTFIREASPADLDWLCEAAAGCRILLTVAPEAMRPGQIARLTEAGVLVFCGHTAASFEQTMSAVSEGAAGFTHLFNAMSPLGSREPGVVGAALLADDTYCGIICDGHHVHADVIRLAHRAKPRGKLLLVSDAMATVGATTKSFELYGETISESGGRLVNGEGRLAGSAISMLDAVRYTHLECGIALDECLRMASRYPAELLGVSGERGYLRPAYRADLVHFDETLSAARTWVSGKPS